MNISKYEIIVVDDIEENLLLLTDLLTKEGYKVRPSTSPLLARKSAFLKPPGLFLLDVNMPSINGFELCKQLKADPRTSDIPVVFVTALTDTASVVDGFKAGGNDYIAKPFRAEEVLSRVHTHLKLYDYELHLKNKIEEGIREISLLNEEIEHTQREVVQLMGTAAEGRSQDVGQHVKRVAEMAYNLARWYGASEYEAVLIRAAAPLHDMGKVAIPDAILNKNGKLNEEEWGIMKTHAQIGFEMLSVSDRPLLKTAALIAYEHHERWDGTGYPRGLKAENISVAGRVTAIADVFDALSHSRCYKEAWKIDEVFSYLKEGRGKHFDPRLIDLVFENIEQLLKIVENIPDSDYINT